ncbi:hypothetical protein MKQ68_19860 [Chitinophaga horti]|uniref:Uncharacterized protein n=1 Tax=Chitinophaga horti TaxID=2920382 RepID=A0ABY6IY86_9BACT|nr:hypothetical protein [Chitinophaga horti]UYQ92344.1 hypothetical protein MKQ68_19860 [Chitinophaga horti]
MHNLEDTKVGINMSNLAAKDPITLQLQDNYFHALLTELRLLRRVLEREDRRHHYTISIDAVRDGEMAATMQNRIAVERALRKLEPWARKQLVNLGAQMVQDLLITLEDRDNPADVRVN